MCELTMPKLDGTAAFRAPRLTPKDVRVILTRRFATDETTVGFAGKGPAGFLRKPFAAEDLLQAVYGVVGG